MVQPGYKKYIESPRWKAKCELYWLKKGRYCQACGGMKMLHVHHMTYERFGREQLTDLMGLCRDCHKEVHALHRRGGRQDLRIVTLQYVNRKRANRLA